MKLTKGALYIVVFMLFNVHSLVAGAPKLIYDDEILEFLDSVLDPLLEVANIHDVNLYIIDDKTPNAFVSGGNNIFVHTGLLLYSDKPSEIIGVLAHELGHIKGGHLLLGKQQASNSYIPIIIGALAGSAAVIAGVDGAAELASTAIMGGVQTAQASIFQFSRSQESIADQYAVSYLNALGYGMSGMVDFMNKLYSKEKIESLNMNVYWATTHPLTYDRLSFFRNAVAKSKNQHQTSQELNQQFQASKYKLIAYYSNSENAVKIKNKNIDPYLQNYSMGIYLYHSGEYKRSLEFINKALDINKGNIYALEYKADNLAGLKKYSDAEKIYSKIAATSGSFAFYIKLSEMEIKLNTKEKLQSALNNLNIATKINPYAVYAWSLKSIAYNKLGDNINADLSMAYKNYYSGEPAMAINAINRVIKFSDKKSSESQEAKDLLRDIENGV